MTILHLSQTDIKSDSRILKEMHSLSNHFSNFNLYGIGVNLGEKVKEENTFTKFKINTINLTSKTFIILPKILIHFFSVIEISFKMFSQAKKIQPNIIHCHDTPVLPVGVLLKFFTNATLIYDAHELESNRNGVSKLTGKLILFAEKVMWRYIDALIVVSPSIEKWYHNNVGEKYSQVILNAPVLEKDITFADKQYLRNKFNISSTSKIFLYIGILGYGRGIDLITDVFKNNNLNSSLVFLGYGDLSDELKKLSEIYPNIYVHDAVTHDKVVSVAKSADVGLCLIQNVSLSDYYCLPNKLFEYAFSEIPVLASDFPDISQAVTKYNLGKYSKLDPISIYKAIKEFEDMDTLPVVQKEKLFELSWESQEKKLQKLYKKLIEEK